LSWLLFLDESGQDHRNTPYEVRGGIALHASKLWSFVQQLQQLELAAFGAHLAEFRTEVKGSKLIDKNRFEWAAQSDWMPDEQRRKASRAFLTKGLEKKSPSRLEFTAYGQASLEMARGVFQILHASDAKLFAAIIPVNATRPDTFQAAEYLRKDQVFLLERFFYFLEERREHGILVFDQVDKGADLKFVRQIERYFSRTQTGRYRTVWIVPTPLFVSSDLTYPTQAADLCIYAINWGFRLPNQGMAAPVRDEVATEFRQWLSDLQYRGKGQRADQVFETYGIFYVPDPYESRDRKG
jgi:Protein of unknown function (DUF3800)